MEMELIYTTNYTTMTSLPSQN